MACAQYKTLAPRQARASQDREKWFTRRKTWLRGIRISKTPWYYATNIPKYLYHYKIIYILMKFLDFRDYKKRCFFSLGDSKRKRKGQNPFGHARKKIYGTTTGKWEVAVEVNWASLLYLKTLYKLMVCQTHSWSVFIWNGLGGKSSSAYNKLL